MRFQMKQFALVAALLAQPALADPLDGTQNHPVQARFVTAPCAEVIAAIDAPAPGPTGLGEMAMTFGFLMGVEVMTPGIRGPYETVLMRLRSDCAASPEKTAMELLRAYAGARP